ncbi:T9SS type A sorting domain-containing protein [Winogradskyella pulchriflava]|uniref:T9SS type A sorting domain-containing protein n=1 Tax=Winogradskyella pulchriflava TaxID=1110688 RepID=A0ABV6Q8D1_9FLAO
MKKITYLVLCMFIGGLMTANAQYSFPAVAGPVVVAAGSPVTLNINDAANAAGVPAGMYSTFSVSVDWAEDAGNPFSSEADLTMTTTAGSVLIDPATTGSAGSANPTTMTFDGTFTADYDPTTDGFMDIVLNQSWSGSSANWSNIVVTIVPALTCTPPAGTVVLGAVDCSAGTFEVDVDITDLGDGSPSLFDGTNTFPIAATGPFSVAGYPIGTPITFTLLHGSDALCDQDLGTIEDGCPIFSAVDCAAGTPVNTTFCYGDDADIQYSFTSSDGSPLRVDFVEGYFEDCCDDIIIYDGLTTSDPVLFQSDTNAGDDATGISAISTGDSVLVRLVSDGSVSCDAGSGSGISLNFDVSCSSCTPATATASVVDDCDISGGFNIVVDITDLGSATDITLSDDQGSADQNVTVIGMYTFGPYVNGTDVSITLADDADAQCTETFASLTQTVCPPANDDCANAIALTPGGVFTDNPVTGQTNAGATDSGEMPLPGCATYDPADVTGNGGDVWYAVTVPSDGNLTIETDSDPTGNGGDGGMAVYSGTCGSLALFECNDDGGNGLYSQVVIEPADGLADQTVYIRVWELGGNAVINFQVSAFSATLGIDDVENSSAFTFYPNPVKNTLTLNAQNTIENVTMYNMLGQEVLRATPNNVDSDLDMSGLQNGTYFIKVTIANTTKTIRVIKQ